MTGRLILWTLKWAVLGVLALMYLGAPCKSESR